MSPTDDLFSTGYPGGIYNNGFAAEWIGERIDDAKPAATVERRRLGADWSPTPVTGVGQPWVYYEIDAELAAAAVRRRPAWPTRHCTSSRRACPRWSGPRWSLRAPARAGTRRCSTGARCRTGPPGSPCRCSCPAPCRTSRPDPSGRRCCRPFPKTTPVFANMVNGGHIDSTDPQIISRWLEFLDIYVADKVPTAPNCRRRAWSSTSSPASRVGTIGPGPAARHPVHRRAKTLTAARQRVRPPDAPGRGPLRQRRRVGRCRRSPVDLLGRVRPVAADGSGHHLLVRWRAGR